MPPRPAAQLAPAPQPAAQPAATQQPSTPAAVNWTLQIFRDGQQIDSFDGTTAVGQARTSQHREAVARHAGCAGEPARSVELQRTVTVSPLRADPSATVLAIDARETVERDFAPQPAAGCGQPPRLSVVHADHPGLVVPAGQWVDWQIVGQNPALLYRVRASLAPR